MNITRMLMRMRYTAVAIKANEDAIHSGSDNSSARRLLALVAPLVLSAAVIS